MEVDGGDGPSRPQETSANDYIEQFTLLAKHSSGKATAAIVKKVLNHKHVYVFAEILELDCVQKLRGTSLENVLTTLEIFAYGVYQDYVKDTSKVCSLNEFEINKLRKLTIVSLGNQQKTLSYSALRAALGVATSRELEDIFIDSVYSGLVTGKLNPREQVVKIDWVMGRDVRKEEFDKMIHHLSEWSSESEKLVETIRTCIQVVSEGRADLAAEESRQIEHILKVCANLGGQSDGAVSVHSKMSGIQMQ